MNMCGRYNIIADAQALVDGFDVIRQRVFDFQPRYNVAPSQDVPVIRQTEEGRELCLMRWGLVPSWSKEEKSKYHLINARAETVSQKPAFRQAFKQRRCLIPASGFYEWRIEPEQQGQKQPYNIRMKDGELFAFAGLWEHWEGEEGKVVESCTIIVTDANSLLTSIHDRMPVILPPKSYDVWLNPNIHESNKLLPLIQPYSPNRMEYYAVSTAVGNAKNDNPELIRRMG